MNAPIAYLGQARPDFVQTAQQMLRCLYSDNFRSRSWKIQSLLTGLLPYANSNVIAFIT